MALMVLLNRMRFAHGAIAEAAGELALAGITRPLVVAGAGVVAAGLWDRLHAALPPALPLAIFAEMPPNPAEAAVRARMDPAGAVMVGNAPEVFANWLAVQRGTAAEVIRAAGITLG